MKGNFALMKIASINNMSSQTKRSEELTTTISKPSFKGSMALVNFWQMIDNGGKGLQFTVEDMCGTNIERTAFAIINDIKTYNRRKKSYEERRKKGQLRPNEKPPTLMTIKSFPSTMQEGVREFLTGPVMTFAPISILALCKKVMGKSSDIKIKNLINLDNLMKSAIAKAGDEAITDKFIREVVEDLLAKTLDGENEKANAEEIEKLISAFSSYFKTFSEEKQDKKTISASLENVQKVFEQIIKQNKRNYDNSTFLNAKYTIGSNVGQTKFKQYVDYASAYLQDITKNTNKLTIEAVDNFKNNRIGKRILTNLTMFFGTAFLMAKIPEIYTKLSGSINPNGVDIYEQASEMNNAKEVK